MCQCPCPELVQVDPPLPIWLPIWEEGQWRLVAAEIIEMIGDLYKVQYEDGNAPKTVSVQESTLTPWRSRL
jgi:hypothetical protein